MWTTKYKPDSIDGYDNDADDWLVMSIPRVTQLAQKSMGELDYMKLQIALNDPNDSATITAIVRELSMAMIGVNVHAASSTFTLND